MERSEGLKELIAALAKAQGEFEGATKSATNPTLRNKYATLDDIIAAIREPLSKNGLVIVQPVTGNDEGFEIETFLMHESGEWMSCSAPILPLEGNKAVNVMQTLGMAITYMRRYMLSSLLGINTEEDTDGSKKPTKKSARKPAQKPPQERMHEAMADAIAPHWIDDDDVRKKFWFWSKGLGLTNDQVHVALDVKSTRDYNGTKADAVKVIKKWAKDNLPYKWTEEAVLAFLTGTREDGLTDEWVMETLKVDGLSYYTGTPGEAMGEINRRIAADVQAGASQESALEFNGK